LGVVGKEIHDLMLVLLLVAAKPEIQTNQSASAATADYSEAE
jgi:hypothetical protein